MTQPKPFKHRLQEIYRVYVRGFENFADDEKLGKINEACQKEFPGNYHVVEAYMPNSFSWGVRLVFDTPADETWFMLQHG